MDAVKFLEEWKRMCDANSVNYCDCKTNCKFCSTGTECWQYVLENPKRSEQYVSEWSTAHPRKTRLQDFLEKYPNAPKDAEGVPRVCSAALGYRDFCEIGIESVNCEQCWNTPIE